MNAQQAGYGAVIVYNNGSDDLVTMHGSMYTAQYVILCSFCLTATNMHSSVYGAILIAD